MTNGTRRQLTVWSKNAALAGAASVLLKAAG